jgi:hypothetical protein
LLDAFFCFQLKKHLEDLKKKLEKRDPVNKKKITFAFTFVSCFVICPINVVIVLFLFQFICLHAQMSFDS